MPRNRRPQSYIVSNPDYQNTTKTTNAKYLGFIRTTRNCK